VCGAVFIAAGMVGEHWLRVALTAMALGAGLYVVPLGIIAHPSLIAWWDAPASALLALLQMGVGLTVLSHALLAPMPIWRKALGTLAGLMLALW
jgi:TRAP-type uncharacterized transport system fused permease subunit